MHVSGNRLHRDLTALGEIGSRPEGGRTRLALSAEDLQARSFLKGLMKEAGLTVRVDQAGNIIGHRAGKDEQLPIIAFGSHIDTVPNAGMLDGCYGVMGALEVMRTLNENHVETAHPLEMICFSNEEGVRFPFHTGSKVACGTLELDSAYAQSDAAGVTYREALEAEGAPIGSLAPALRRRGEVKAWVELHIEQGPVLEKEGLKIGVVEAIVGLKHIMVEILGETGHAGTVPMSGRRDPAISAARLVLEVKWIASEIGDKSVATVGVIKVTPGAMNVIPKSVEVGIDLRDAETARLENGAIMIKRAVDVLCDEGGVEYSLRETASTAPALMSEKVVRMIEASAVKLDAPCMRMPSGAGHDTQNMASICDVGMIFVPSRGGISHAPEEYTSPEDLATGTDVLLNTVLELAKAPET